MRADEHRLQNALLVELSKIDGCVAWRNTVGTFRAYSNPEKIVKAGTPGQADVFAVYEGRFFSIELKAPKGRKRDRQEAWARTVVKCGGTHMWAKLRGGEEADIRSTVHEVVTLVKERGPQGVSPGAQSSILGATREGRAAT